MSIKKKSGGQLKYIANDNIFDNITNNEAYLLGFLITDGYISKKYHKIGIQLSIKDIEHLNNIKKLISPNSNIRTSNRTLHGKIYGICCLEFTSHKIYNYLLSIGFTNQKTWSPPNLFNIIPKQYHWDYFRGIFDGDGCISHTTRKKIYYYNRLSIVSFSEGFLNSIKDFVGCGSIYKPKHKRCPDYRVNKVRNIVEICKKMYLNKDCIKLERKYEKFLEIESNCNGNRIDNNKKHWDLLAGEGNG